MVRSKVFEVWKLGCTGARKACHQLNTFGRLEEEEEKQVEQKEEEVKACQTLSMQMGLWRKLEIWFAKGRGKWGSVRSWDADIPFSGMGVQRFYLNIMCSHPWVVKASGGATRGTPTTWSACAQVWGLRMHQTSPDCLLDNDTTVCWSIPTKARHGGCQPHRACRHWTEETKSVQRSKGSLHAGPSLDHPWAKLPFLSPRSTRL